MKTSIKKMIYGGLFATTLGFANSCENESIKASDEIQYAQVIDVSTDGTTTMIETNTQSALVETPALSESELNSLLKMKAEEQLARDVYSELYTKWGSIQFSRIARAENNHLNAIVTLLKYYGASDTVIGNAGVFSDAAVQTLYNELIAKGSVSNEEAFKVGALIEEMDIYDLGVAVKATSNANIILVLENLEKGSRNHLRAFNKQLTILGAIYTPEYLSQTEYDQIVSSSIEKGKQYKMKAKGNGKGKGKGGRGKGNGNAGNGQGQQGNGSCSM